MVLEYCAHTLFQMLSKNQHSANYLKGCWIKGRKSISPIGNDAIDCIGLTDINRVHLK